MLQQQYKAVTAVPSIVPDNPGTRVSYRRFNGVKHVVLSGVIVGVITSIPRRCQEVQFDYIVMPTDDQYRHLSGMVVNEGDVLWGAPKCERCNDRGYISLRGDEAQECPVCNVSNDEVTF